MRKKILVSLVAFVLATGWTTFNLRAEQMPGAGEKVPVIVQSFASKELRAGDVWKVYLKASDPEGEMKYIFATIFQPGVGIYSVSITRIKKENRKEFSGYLFLNTAPAPSSAFFNHTLSLTINIQGKGGVFSQPAVFPLSFNFRSDREVPPDGVFKEQNLGPIMITLRAVSGG